jgi:two-component sensor histidine kinase
MRDRLVGLDAGVVLHPAEAVQHLRSVHVETGGLLKKYQSAIIMAQKCEGVPGQAQRRADRIMIAGENIRFPPKAAMAISIAFNELATNAVKYGALSNAVGSILIEWTMETTPAEKRLLLNWTEKGGPPVTPPAHKGFGSRVIERGLAHELEGTVHLDYRPDGLVCTMDIPLPGGARGG